MRKAARKAPQRNGGCFIDGLEKFG